MKGAGNRVQPSEDAIDDFDLLKSISDRLFVLEQSFHKITKDHKLIQKKIQDEGSHHQQLFGQLKFQLLQQMKQQIETLVGSGGYKNRKGRAKSEIVEEAMEQAQRAETQRQKMEKMKEDIAKLKQDTNQTYNIASIALKRTEAVDKHRIVEQAQSHCEKLLEISMNEVMRIITNYVEDQSLIRMEIEKIKDQVHIAGGFPSPFNKNNSPNNKRSKRPSSFSKTDKKSNKADGEWDVVSERKKGDGEQRERVMTHTDGNKSGKSFQKITDLREKLKQFEMISDKYRSGKKEKGRGMEREKEKEKEREKEQQQPERQHEHQEQPQQVKSRPQQQTNQKSQRNEPSERKSVEFSKSKKEGAEVIDQLKKFKHLLENTESEIDISNPVEVDLANSPDYSKFQRLSKLYSGGMK